MVYTRLIVMENEVGIFDHDKELMVRSPRFEPGSSAWQADVLDQTRLRPPLLKLESLRFGF